MAAFAKRNKAPTEMALTASHKAFIHLDAAADVEKEVLEITRKAVPSDTSIGTARKDTIQATAYGESVIRLSGG